MSAHEILIIGGGPASLATAHNLLKTTIPKASKATGQKYRVTMLSASSHFWFTVGTVRAVVSPANFPQDKIRVNIKENFPKYSPDQFRFIHGAATSVDFKTKSVGFTPRDVTDAPKEQSLTYDTLIIASGSHHSSNVWKLNEQQDLEASINALKDMNEKIREAKSIVIAGGGPVSVETSGEIMTWFTGIDKKDVTLVTAAPKILPTLKHPDISRIATTRLNSAGVKVRTDSKVQKVDKTSGGYTITLSSGDVLKADLYIDATGVHANSSFLPANIKDANGWVSTDDQLHVTAAGEGVFAVGDIVSISNRTFFAILDQVPIMTESWLRYVAPNAVKGEGKKVVERPYDMIVVPIGKNFNGVGAIFGWKLLGFFVWLLKGRTMMMENVTKYVKG